MYPDFSIQRYFRELGRPWKLFTFALALAYYIWGAYYYRLPTWDVPVSIIMASLTYIFAPWVVKSASYLLVKRPHFWFLKFLVCMAVTYACASGSYELYHIFWGIGYHPPTYWPNLYYSTLMFMAAGIFWKFDGSLKEIFLLKKKEFKSMPDQKKIFFLVMMFLLSMVLVVAVLQSLQLPQLR